MFLVCSRVFQVWRIVEENQRPSTVEIIIEIRLDGVKWEFRGVWGEAPGSALREGNAVWRGRRAQSRSRTNYGRLAGIWGGVFGAAGSSKAPGARLPESSADRAWGLVRSARERYQQLEAGLPAFERQEQKARRAEQPDFSLGHGMFP